MYKYPKNLISVAFLAVMLHCSSKSNSISNNPAAGTVPGIVVNVPAEATSISAKIAADSGGQLSIGNSVQLTIPAGALNEDTEISIAKAATAAPQENLVPVGNTLNFGAEGIEFNQSVTLNVCYDSAALAAKGLPEDTVQVYYVDDAGNYAAIGGAVNKTSHCVTAQLQHFSTYLIAAQILQGGNNPPVVSAPTFTPSVPLAGLPLKISSVITDYELNAVNGQVGFGQVATAKLYYRIPGEPSFTQVALTPDYLDDTATRYSYKVPANRVTTAGIEYYIKATDNLGLNKQRNAATLAIARTATAINFNIGTAINLTAGFKRSYTVRSVDDLGTVRNIDVDSFTLNNGIGTAAKVSPSVIQVTATTANAQNYRIGSLTANAGTFSVTSQDIRVHAGYLDHIALLSQTGVVLGATINVNANATYDFDVMGYDAFGNTSNVLPQFVIVPVSGAGTITSTGLYTAPATAQTATLVATLDGVMDSILINVVVPATVGLPPAMVVPPTVPTMALGMGLANNGIDTYAIWVEVGSPGWNLVLSRWNGAAWINLATATSTTAIFNADLAFVNGQPVIAYTAEEVSPSPPLRNVRFYRWNGAALEPIASPAIGGVSASTGQVDIVANGNLLYATWQELTGGFYNIHVSVWNSSTNTWSSPLGAQVNPVGVSSYFPKIELYQSQPLVLFSANGAVTLRRWDGISAWAAVSPAVSGDLNFPGAGTQINGPQLAVDGSHIYLAWSAFDGSMTNVYAGHYDAGLDTYVILGGGAADSFSTFKAGAFVSLRLYSGVPYLAFYKEDPTAFKTYVQHFSGGVWVPDFNSSSPTNFAGPSFNETAAKHNTIIALSEVSGMKYVTFVEFDGAYLGSPSTMYLRTLP